MKAMLENIQFQFATVSYKNENIVMLYFYREHSAVLRM